MKRKGPHKVCKRCDWMVDGELCPLCKRYDKIGPCSGACIRCVEPRKG